MGRAGQRTAELAGRARAQLLAPLLGQLDTVRTATALSASVVDGTRPPERARRTMQELRGRSDRHRSELSELLHRALSAPIDREDLYRLSRALDDVLGNLGDFIREVSLFTVGDLSDCAGLFGPLDTAVGELRRGVELLASGRHTAVAAAEAAQRARGASETLREAYERALCDLLNAEHLDPELLKRRELLRRLDVVGLRIASAANILADGCIKRGP